MPNRTRRPSTSLDELLQQIRTGPQAQEQTQGQQPLFERTPMLRSMSTIQCHQQSRTPMLDDLTSFYDLAGQRTPSKPRPTPDPISAGIPEVAEPRPSMRFHGREKLLLDWTTYLKEQNGDDFQKYVPTHGGPGRDLRGQGSPESVLPDQLQQNVYPAIVPETHRELMHTHLPESVRESLMGIGQWVHEPYSLGTGHYNVDEYSMILDELPAGFDSPEAFLQGFLRDPNGFANDTSNQPLNPWEHEGAIHDFDVYNWFTLMHAGGHDEVEGQHVPQVGDWYHIDIPGNDGDVIIVDYVDRDGRVEATVQTMTDDEWFGRGDHPVSGRREFGIEQLPDGGYRFYTRGFDRQTKLIMDPPMSNSAQHADWSCLMEAMAEEHSGRPERTDDRGEPKWGWCRQIPGSAMISSMQEQKKGDGPDR